MFLSAVPKPFKHIFFVIFLAAACFAIYANSLKNDFVFDDLALVKSNAIIRSPERMLDGFKALSNDQPTVIRNPRYLAEGFKAKYWRPMQIISYAFDYRVWKLRPFGYHLTNTLLHLFNAVLLYYLLRRVLGTGMIPKAAAIIFLVHPVHTSAVSYIAGRADLLAAFFMFSAMLLFLRHIDSGTVLSFLASLLCAALALLCRESAVLLFLFIALILFTLKQRPRLYLFVLPFIGLDIIYFFFRSYFFGLSSNVNILPSFSPILQLINFLNIAVRYLAILFLPQGLHLVRTTPLITDLSGIWPLALLILVLSAVFFVIKFRKNRMILFAAAWFFIGLMPVLACLDMYKIPNVAVMTEHWLYISSAGFFIIFVYLLSKLGRLGAVLLVAFTVFYGLSTMLHNNYWKNNVTLYRHILDSGQRGKEYLHFNLANSYLDMGDQEGAFEEAVKFSEYYPDTPHSYYLWGNYYLAAGVPDKAAANYDLALNRDKNFSFAYYYRGYCYGLMGRIDQAIDSALQCFRVSPEFAPNLALLGDLYCRNKQTAQAKKYYRMAQRLYPDDGLIEKRITHVN